MAGTCEGCTFSFLPVVSRYCVCTLWIISATHVERNVVVGVLQFNLHYLSSLSVVPLVVLFSKDFLKFSQQPNIGNVNVYDTFKRLTSA